MALKQRVREQIFLVAFLIAVPLEAVTVPIICPTNKIAPHRRHITNWDYGNARTFGAFYNLLAPNSLQGYAPSRPPYNDLVENPQEDDPDDCGEIEDYDENDLSSITQQVQRRRGQDKTFFPGHRPPQNYPMRPPSTIRPQRPQRPQSPNYAPTRPPYWSGGLFGTNDYRPPLLQYPSDSIKPIHESSENFQPPYRPSLVGGPSGHIIGVSPAIPTTTTNFEATTSRPFFPNRTPRYDPERTTFRTRYPSRVPPTQRPILYPIRGQRPRSMNNNGVIGSFVDLLF